MVNGSRYLLPITRLLVSLSSRLLTIYLSTRLLTIYLSTRLLTINLFTCLLISSSTNPTNLRQYFDLSSVALCDIPLLMRQARVW